MSLFYSFAAKIVDSNIYIFLNNAIIIDTVLNLFLLSFNVTKNPIRSLKELRQQLNHNAAHMSCIVSRRRLCVEALQETTNMKEGMMRRRMRTR